jgi:hypothetical protein
VVCGEISCAGMDGIRLLTLFSYGMARFEKGGFPAQNSVHSLLVAPPLPNDDNDPGFRPDASSCVTGHVGHSRRDLLSYDKVQQLCWTCGLQLWCCGCNATAAA